MIQVFKDPQNFHKLGSTNLIVDNLNLAAKELGIFSKSGNKCVYDCLGNTFGLNPNAIICPYELNIPDFIKNNFGGRKALGVSRDNMFNFFNAGYTNCDYFLLGVDSNKFRYAYREKNNDSFTFLVFGESNSRGCLEKIIEAFIQVFGGYKDIQLIIKDRAATPTFQNWVKEMSNTHNANIVHDIREVIQEEEIELAMSADACVSINRASTFNLRALQGLSLGLPTIGLAYSGAREYMQDYDTALLVEYDLADYTNEKVNGLKSLGLNNYLFPAAYHPNPMWAEPRVESIMNKMLEMKDSPNLRRKLSINGRKMAETLSWTRSAKQLNNLFD